MKTMSPFLSFALACNLLLLFSLSSPSSSVAAQSSGQCTLVCANGGVLDRAACQCMCPNFAYANCQANQTLDAITCRCINVDNTAASTCNNLTCPLGHVLFVATCTCQLPQDALYLQLWMVPGLITAISDTAFFQTSMSADLSQQLGVPAWRLQTADLKWQQKANTYTLTLAILQSNIPGQVSPAIIASDLRKKFSTANPSFKSGEYTRFVDSIWAQCGVNTDTSRNVDSPTSTAGTGLLVRQYAAVCKSDDGSDSGLGTGQKVVVWLLIVVISLCVVTFFWMYCCGKRAQCCWDCQDGMVDCCQEWCWWCPASCRGGVQADGSVGHVRTKKIARPGGQTWGKLAQLEERGVRI
jgi:hypothetical protein